jgi:uracil phosphoribosyltransferase
MVTNLSATNSIVSQWMSEIRDTAMQADRSRFRRNIERIGEACAYEISKTLRYKSETVTTPLGQSLCAVLETQPVVATILRAGLPLFNGILNFFDDADGAFIGAYRKHHPDESFEICQQYLTNPPLDDRPLIIADPMLATGASIVLALDSILANENPSVIHIVCVIACREGIDYVQKRFPNAYIWAAAIDDELSQKGYIVPGLGDAGDLSFGKKRQS